MDGKPVTDETLLTQIKNTRDAVGGKVKLLIGSQVTSRLTYSKKDGENGY